MIVGGERNWPMKPVARSVPNPPSVEFKDVSDNAAFTLTGPYSDQRLEGPQMNIFAKFSSDQKGDVLKSVAASAAVIAFASLALTQLLDKATRDGSLPRIAIITGNDDAAMRMASLPRPTSNSPGVGGQYDDTPVGSIAGRPMPRVVLDPCTGKNR